MDEEVEAMFQVRAARLAAGPEPPLPAAAVEEEPEPEPTGGKPLFVTED